MAFSEIFNKFWVEVGKKVFKPKQVITLDDLEAQNDKLYEYYCLQ
jgi:hypothetical protein